MRALVIGPYAESYALSLRDYGIKSDTLAFLPIGKQDYDFILILSPSNFIENYFSIASAT